VEANKKAANPHRENPVSAGKIREIDRERVTFIVRKIVHPPEWPDDFPPKIDTWGSWLGWSYCSSQEPPKPAGAARDMITRFMGLIVLSMGVQFAVTGLRKFGTWLRVHAHVAIPVVSGHPFSVADSWAARRYERSAIFLETFTQRVSWGQPASLHRTHQGKAQGLGNAAW
jgi:hypothetical protein